MKHLYLIRHAKAIQDSSFKDFDRTLNPRGADDARIMGSALKQKNIVPQEVISSPAVRAISTAKIICKELDFPVSKIELNNSLYESYPDIYINTIQDASDASDVVFLFAHNPTITDTANILARTPVTDHIPTCGIVGLSFDINSWKKLETGTGKLFLFEYPKGIL